MVLSITVKLKAVMLMKSDLPMKFNSVYTIVVAFITIVMTSCSVEIIESDSSKTVTIRSLTAVASSDVQETKTIIDGATLKPSWLAGDAINVFFGASEGSKFVCQASGKTAQFKGSIDVVTGGGDELTDETYLWGVYPYHTDTTCDGKNTVFESSS